mgnify:CR=1 FL=1
MAWHRTVTEKAFFVIIFVLVTTIGLASLLGISGSDILETAVNAAISTAIAVLITALVFWSERRRATRG